MLTLRYSKFPYYAFISLCIVLIHLGSGRHFLYIQYILDNRTINQTEVLDFAAHLIYTTALLLCRLSGLAFYARISNRNEKLIWAIRIAAIFITAAYLPQIFLIIFHCLPVTGFWPYAFQSEVNNFKCLQWGEVYVTNSVISLICDLILFTIPSAIIAMLQLSLYRKIMLSLVMMPGLLVIAISLTRMYLVIVGQWEADESWSYDLLLTIEVSEIGSTLIALSAPALKPFFGSVFEFLDRTFISTASKDRSRIGGGRSKNARPSGDGIMELNNRSDGHSKSASELGGMHDHPKDVQYTSSARYTPTDERHPSFGSNVSEQPIIKRQIEYSVSHDQGLGAPHAR